MISGSRDDADERSRDIRSLQDDLQRLANDRLLLEVNTRYQLKSKGLWSAKSGGTSRGIASNVSVPLSRRGSSIAEDDFIEIPEFVPEYLRGNNLLQSSSAGGAAGEKDKGKKGSSLFVRPSMGQTMVPVMRHGVGSLPPEIAAIRSVPTDNVPLIEPRKKYVLYYHSIYPFFSRYNSNRLLLTSRVLERRKQR